jgi:hypothetical protein
MEEKIKFPCGSSGSAEFCPSGCQFGRFCKFLKEQTIKPRGQAAPPVRMAQKQSSQSTKKDKPVEVMPYY